MKSIFISLLFIGASLAVPDSHLLDLGHSTIVSSITGLVNTVPTLLEDPDGECI